MNRCESLRFRYESVRFRVLRDIVGRQPLDTPWDTARTPTGHRQYTAEIPLGHHRDTAGTPPGHQGDTTGTPPGHHRDTTVHEFGRILQLWFMPIAAVPQLLEIETPS